MRRLVDERYQIDYEDPWFYDHGRKFGFFLTDDEGRKMVVCHRYRLATFNKEYGFYVPAYFVKEKARLLFEVKKRKSKDPSYTHFIFHPNRGTRMILTYPQVFLSVNRMEITTNAVHIPKRRS